MGGSGFVGFPATLAEERNAALLKEARGDSRFPTHLRLPRATRTGLALRAAGAHGRPPRR